MRQVLLEKTKRIEEIKRLLREYRVLGVASLHKVRASQLQEIRKNLGSIANLKVYKNTLVERSLEELKDKPYIEKLKDCMRGSNLYIFTNFNPFKLALLIKRSKMKAYAKAGDIALEDVVVPAGNTGLPPGPIISQLNAVGIPTRIESGSVWVSRDTVVAKRGTVISESLAAALSKLGIKPIELGLSLKAVYDDGVVLLENDLAINFEDYKKSISEAYAQSFNFAVNVAFPIPETISVLLYRAIFDARSLTVNANVFLPEFLPDIIRKAYVEALALEAKFQERQVSKQ